VKLGVKKIVHVSITNPSKDSKLEYFNGKAVLEEYLINLGIPYTILRPTVLFGKEDILINNIAWMVRKFPVFAVFGNGDYRIQPIFVDDLAELAIRYGKDEKNSIIDAIGPETFKYRSLIEVIMKELGISRKIIKVSPAIGYILSKVMSFFVKDVVITKPEIEGLMSDLLYTDSKPAGSTLFSKWIKENKTILGKSYASELGRRK